MMVMANILIVYCQNFEFPPRVSLTDLAYSFRRETTHKCYYLNASFQYTPFNIEYAHIDLIIFDMSFFSQRLLPYLFKKCMTKVESLKKVKAIKIILPQDEYIYTDQLCEFINEFQISHVFSVAPKSEWTKIYDRVDFNRVKFYSVLTGYLSERTIDRIAMSSILSPGRTIDIGYRARSTTYSLGKHGLMKITVAEYVAKRSGELGLILDISNRAQDTYLGDSWYKFLLRCKYTIGVEGGASILDRDGSIRDRTERYLKEHPGASFDEVESHCFPDQDGKLQLFAISPRHLEACATRTCQVLIEGDYNGILRPGVHYIELKRDFSNIDQVLETIKRDDLRETITERAYNDIVASGKYSYRSFVEFVLEQSAGLSLEAEASSVISRYLDVFYVRMLLNDALSWIKVVLYARLYIPLANTLFRTMRQLMPIGVPEALMRWFRGETV